MEGAKIASRKQLIDSEIGERRRGTTITITITQAKRIDDDVKKKKLKKIQK